MDLLRNLKSEIEQRGLTGGAGKADTLALRSRFTYTPSGFRRLVRSSLTSLINQRKCSTPLPVLLSKRVRKRAEKSGKLGPQIVESNEINLMEKTLNQ